MSIFRAIAFVLFVIGAILSVVFGDFKEVGFYICAGLAALTLAGSSLDRSVT